METIIWMLKETSENFDSSYASTITELVPHLVKLLYQSVSSDYQTKMLKKTLRVIQNFTFSVKSS